MASGKTLTTGSPFFALIQWDAECSDLLRTIEAYPTGESLFDVYWRTLCANLDIDMNTPGKEIGESFRWWRKSMYCMAKNRSPGKDIKDWHLLVDETEADICSHICYAFIYTYFELWSQPWHQPWWWAAVLCLMFYILASMALTTVVMWCNHWLRRRADARYQLGGPFQQLAFQFSATRLFSKTKRNHVGLVPPAARAGDTICFFQGC